VLVQERDEERTGPGAVTAPDTRLLRAGQRLAAGGRHATLEAFPQGGAEAGQRVWNPLHPGGDGLPVGAGAGRHEVEDLANRLHRTADDAQIPEPLADRVAIDGCLEPLAHNVSGQPVALAFGGQRRERAQRRPVQLGPGGSAIRRCHGLCRGHGNNGWFRGWRCNCCKWFLRLCRGLLGLYVCGLFWRR